MAKEDIQRGSRTSLCTCMLICILISCILTEINKQQTNHRRRDSESRALPIEQAVLNAHNEL